MKKLLPGASFDDKIQMTILSHCVDLIKASSKLMARIGRLPSRSVCKELPSLKNPNMH